jgi:oxygen-independent coproporphyrinogen-3 oxidase
MDQCVSVYLHIPFCTSKCTYCAFNTYIKLESLIPDFVDALIREIEIVGQSKPGQVVHTIFLGGGTPSLLTPEQLARIIATLDANFQVLPDCEISIETNPNDIHEEYALGLAGTGINRLSIGMQSAHNNELQLFARRHDNDQVAKAFHAARKAGFDNINLDLIYGIPHQTLTGWEWTLAQAIKLQAEHISLYALGLEDGTPMRDWVMAGRLPTPDDDLTADMYDMASAVLTANGYVQYEISNWAKPGYECVHNLQYWRNLPYIGVGPGAHGYADQVRYSTLLSPQEYTKRLLNVTEPVDYVFPRTPVTDEANLVDGEGEIAETLIMGLRLTQEGIRRNTFIERFGEDLLSLRGDVIQKYVNYGLLHVDDEQVRITTEGRLLSNAIFRDLV